MAPMGVPLAAQSAAAQLWMLLMLPLAPELTSHCGNPNRMPLAGARSIIPSVNSDGGGPKAQRLVQLLRAPAGRPA